MPAILGYLIGPLGKGLLVVVVLGMIYVTGRQHGADAVERRVEAEMLKEQARQREALALVEEEARKREATLIGRIATLGEVQKEIIYVAAKDPNADRVCLSVDSVQRLNSLK